jgi:hypothetical protein
MYKKISYKLSILILFIICSNFLVSNSFANNDVKSKQKSNKGLQDSAQKKLRNIARMDDLLKNNPNEVLKVVDKRRALEGSFIATIEVVDKNLTTNKENKFLLNIGANQEKSFAIYQFPNNQKGQTILNLGQNLWIYIPSTSNPIKISPQQKLVGQASIADIVSLLYYKNYKVISYVKKNDAYVLKLENIGKNTAYNYIALFVDEKGFPLKAIFYSLSKKALKTMYFENIQQLGNAKRPAVMRIVNRLDKNLVTEVTFKSMEAKNIPQNHFNKEFIGRLASVY